MLPGQGGGAAEGTEVTIAENGANHFLQGKPERRGQGSDSAVSGGGRVSLPNAGRQVRGSRSRHGLFLL